MEPEQSIPPTNQGASAPQIPASDAALSATEDAVVLTGTAQLTGIAAQLHYFGKLLNVTLYKTHLKIDVANASDLEPNAGQIVVDVPIAQILDVKTSSWFQQQELKAQWQLKIQTPQGEYKIHWLSLPSADAGLKAAMNFGGFTPPNGLSFKDWNQLWVNTINSLKSGTTPTPAS